MLDLTKGKITLVLVPWDLRAGYYKLSQTAKNSLRIDVEEGNDWVVFISKHRNFAKIIHSDTKGNILISRRLRQGCYQQSMAQVNDIATKSLSKDELIRYLNGDDLEVKRTNLFKG